VNCKYYVEVDFGCVWGFKNDNWHISWNPKTKVLSAKGVIKNNVVEIIKCDIDEAKRMVNLVKENPYAYLGRPKG